MSELHEIAGCDRPDRKLDVIFIHGLGGDAFGTWRQSDDEATFWPRWLAQDLPEAGVWSLGYPASPTRHMRWVKWIPWLGPKLAGANPRHAGYAAALPDRAVQVLDQLRVHARFGLGRRPIVLVCHSLGGLLAKHMLRASVDAIDDPVKKFADQVRGVLFLATPHTGSVLAKLVSSFSTVFQTTFAIEELREHDAHSRNLHVWYRDRAAQRGWKTVTYYEQKPVFGVLPIVNATSADPGVGHPVGLDENHLSIAKPDAERRQVHDAAVHLAREAIPGPIAAVTRSSVATTTAQQPDNATAQPATERPSVLHVLPPAAAKGLIGRERLRAELATRLAQGRNTWLVGPAGMGKTALAVAALQDALGERDPNATCRQLYPNGVVTLDLYRLRGHLADACDALANQLRGWSFLAGHPAIERALAACDGGCLLLVVEGAEELNRPGELARLLHEILPLTSRFLAMTRELSQADASLLVRLDSALDPKEAGQLLDRWTAGGPVSAVERQDVLALAQGHPLALNWAGAMLARADEPAGVLVQAWQQQPLANLADPQQSRHTLEWLFRRSEQHLPDDARLVLALIGNLAHAPVKPALLAAATDWPDGDQSQRLREALRAGVRAHLLRHMTDTTGHHEWQATHVLAYQFARQHLNIDSQAQLRLASFLAQALQLALSAEGDGLLGLIDAHALQGHAIAILQSDPQHDAAAMDLSLVQPLMFDVAEGWVHRGHLSSSKQAVEAAQTWFLRAAPDADIGGTRWRRDLTVCQIKIGDLLFASGNIGSALDQFSKALRIRMQLADADPTNAAWQRDLVVVFGKIGHLHRTQGNFVEAQHADSAMHQILMTLVTANPDDATLQRDLGISSENVGDTHLLAGNLTEAQKAFSVQHAIAQQLAVRNPEDFQAQRDLCVSHLRVGQARQALGDLSGAINSFENSLEIAERLVKHAPQRSDWLSDFGVCSTQMGDAHLAQGSLEKAIQSFASGLEVRERLTRQDPNNSNWQRDVCASLNRLGDAHLASGDLQAANQAYSDALVRATRLASEWPNNARFQDDLLVSLLKTREC